MYFSKEMNQSIQVFCEICLKNIDDFQKKIECCLCHCKLHFKCNKKKIPHANIIDDRFEYSFCLNCKENITPSQMNTDISKKKSENLNQYLKEFFKSVNEINENHKKDNDDDDDLDPHTINCKYIDIESFSFKENSKNLSFFI